VKLQNFAETVKPRKITVYFLYIRTNIKQLSSCWILGTGRINIEVGVEGNWVLIW
jgi:hypothetical protein